jgi:uncharacterized protein YcaQ
MGVGTLTDILDVHRLARRELPRPYFQGLLADLADAGHVRQVEVQGWNSPAYADTHALDLLAAGELSGRSRTTLLSPFDSLIWHRERTSRLFDFDYQMELYVPQRQRVHGYFTMPVLHGGRLVARVDPKRDNDILHARQVTFETGRRGGVPSSAITGTAAALREAASWVSATDVQVDRVVPDSARAALASALTRP